MTDESKIRLLRNRHPADQIADVRAEIKQLELREEELRQWLIAHPDDLVGETVEARLKISSRKRLIRGRSSPS